MKHQSLLKMCVSLQELCYLKIAPGDTTSKNIVDKICKCQGQQLKERESFRWARVTWPGEHPQPRQDAVVAVESLQVLDHHAPSMLLILKSLWIVWPVGTPKCDQGVTAGGSRFCLYPFLFTLDAAVLAQDSQELCGQLESDTPACWSRTPPDNPRWVCDPWLLKSSLRPSGTW